MACGTLKCAILSRANCLISASVAAAPIFRTTKACGASPHRSFGNPTTAHSSTDGWRNSTPSTSTDADGGGATASGETHDGGAGGDATEPKTPPAPAALALPSASAKLKFKTTKPFDLELKSDGALSSGGKPAAKISGMELQDAGGKGQLKVDSDGTVTTADGAAYAKFSGSLGEQF